MEGKERRIQHRINDILKQLNKTVRRNGSMLKSQIAFSEYYFNTFHSELTLGAAAADVVEPSPDELLLCFLMTQTTNNIENYMVKYICTKCNIKILLIIILNLYLLEGVLIILTYKIYFQFLYKLLQINCMFDSFFFVFLSTFS